MEDLKIVFWIPAYNEEQSIESVVAGLTKMGTVVVFDDGSSDQTATTALDCGAVVFRNVKNSGYEFAISAAKEYAIHNNFDLLVTLDADGQHSTEAVKSVVDGFGSYQTTSVVLGARKSRPRLSEKLFSICSSLSIGVRDPTSGLKAYNVKVLKTVRSELGNVLGSEVLIEVGSAGYTIREIDIDVSLRQFGPPRFGAQVEGELKVLKALLLFLCAYIRSVFTP